MKKMLKCKSKHKYFGFGRIASTFGVFTLIALLCVSMISVTTSNGYAGGSSDDDSSGRRKIRIKDVFEELQAFQARFETIAQEIEDSADGGITAAKNEIMANTDALEASVNQFIRDTHLVDPFDVVVNICTEIEGGAAFEGLAGLGIGANLEAHLGVDFYGSGAQIGIEPAGGISAGIALRSDVEMYVSACINGIFARQDQDLTEEAAVIASVDASDQAFIAELFEVGNNYRNRVKDTAEATNLVVVNANGFDRLNTSLDAFEGVTTLNAQKLGQFIVSSFDGNDPTSQLGTLVGDLSAAGNGMGTVLQDVAGMFDLSNGNFTSINSAISTGITALGLGTGGSGLSGLSDLSSFGTALTDFKAIETTINTIVTQINSIPNVISNAASAAASAAESAIKGLVCPIPGVDLVISCP